MTKKELKEKYGEAFDENGTEKEQALQYALLVALVGEVLLAATKEQSLIKTEKIFHKEVASRAIKLLAQTTAELGKGE